MKSSSLLFFCDENKLEVSNCMDPKYWELAKDLMNAATGTDTSKGIAKLKERWEANKSYLEPFFDEKGQIVVQLDEGGTSEECLRETFKEARRIAAVISTTHNKYKDIIRDNGRAAVEYLERICKRVLTPNEFKNNAIDRRMTEPYRTNRYLQPGTKVTKFMRAEIENSDTGYFSLWSRCGILGSAYNKEHCEEVISFINDVYSQIIGLLRTSKDYVVLSINPVDFMLCSYHTTGWATCHRILPYDDQGDWMTASLSFICDKVSAIAFAYRSIDEVEEVGFNWPRRIWRQMVYFDREDKGAFQGNEYPSRTMIYSKAMRSIVGDVLCKICNDTSGKFLFTPYDPVVYIEGMEEGSFHIGIDSPEWLSCDYPSIAIRLEDGSYTDLYVGADRIPCMSCGLERRHTSDYDSQSLLCNHCDLTQVTRCECCGCRVNLDNTYDTNDGAVCSSCYQEYFECPVCLGMYHSDSACYTEVYGEGYVEYCKACYDELIRCHNCGIMMYHDDCKSLDYNNLCPKCFAAILQLRKEGEEVIW